MTNKILAIDTATEQCSVAIYNNGEVISQQTLAPREHTQKVLPMVDELLAQSGLTLSQMDALAFGRGPGSFTGVRIGIGIAQGLAFGAELPMVGISNLQAMAQGAHRTQGAEKVCVAIDARMTEVYTGSYQYQGDNQWQLLLEEEVVAPEHLAENALLLSQAQMVIAGTGWTAYEEALAPIAQITTDSGILYPDAQDIVVLANEALKRGETLSAEEAQPVYLRDKVTWKKLPGRE